MKKLMVIVVSVMFCAGVANADEGRAARRRLAKSPEYTGGHLLRPSHGKSILIANAQTFVAEGVLRGVAEDISHAVGLRIVVSRLENPVVEPSTLRNDRTAAAIVVRDTRSTRASTVVVAPEDAWAIVDVGALARDGAEPEVIAERVRKELWRATAIMLGASDSVFSPCLLAPVHSLAELDALKARQVCPEPYGNIQRNAKALGCEHSEYVTYRKSCEEGWAPPPTNDVQKAIWDEIHAIPSAPMKIEFDPKKGR